MIPRPMPLVLVAGLSDEGTRLDRFIRDRSGVLSRIRARDLLASGAVRVNGRRVKISSRPIRSGDRVEVFPLAAEKRSGPPPGMEPFRIVHEDAAVMVVDKAPGVLVQPTRQGDRGTLLELIRRHLRRKHGLTARLYLGLLHRIDRETSGMLLFTRRGAANRILAEQFRTHSIAREYLTLVRGKVRDDAGTITDRLARPNPGGRRIARPSSRPGRRAVTRYRVRERFGAATLLAVTLETGRTHQIRIHLAGRGYPVVGDRVYAPPTGGGAHSALDRFPRHALHASRLGFTHPFTGAWLEFHSPLPEDFRRLLETLRSTSTSSAAPEDGSVPPGSVTPSF